MVLQEWLDEKYSKVEQLALTALDCSDSGVTSLKGIENIRNLTNLICRYIEITSLEGVENLSKLKFLICSNTKITSLKGIENLSKLRDLVSDLEYDRIEIEQERLRIEKMNELIKQIYE